MPEAKPEQLDLVRVASAGSNEEASILRSYLEHHEIYVYVQGENHRSMLGMVGAYIDLNIMVPRNRAAEAQELLKEFHEANEEDEELADTRGPFRDEEEAEDADETAPSELEIRRAVRAARMAALILPLGGGHLSVGATARGVVLALVSIAGFVLAVSRTPILGLLWPMAVAADFYLVPKVVQRRLTRRQGATLPAP